MSSAPLAHQLYEVLGHKLVNVVIASVVYAVDVGKPPIPACPLPIAYPTLGEACNLDAIGIQAVAGYCHCLPLEVVSGCNHKEMWAGRIVSLTTPTCSLLNAPDLFRP